MRTDGAQLFEELRHYQGGSETVYFHSLARAFHYTAGVREFAFKAGAYWLLDILATEPTIKRHVMTEGFALVQLKVIDTTAVLTVANDDNVEPILTKSISYTDCPAAPVSEHNPGGFWTFYIEQTVVGDAVVPICLLPVEH